MIILVCSCNLQKPYAEPIRRHKYILKNFSESYGKTRVFICQEFITICIYYSFTDNNVMSKLEKSLFLYCRT